MIPVLTGCRCITSGSWPAIPLSRLIFVFVALQQICIRMDLLAEKFYDVTNGKTQNPNFMECRGRSRFIISQVCPNIERSAKVR